MREETVSVRPADPFAAVFEPLFRSAGIRQIGHFSIGFQIFYFSKHLRLLLARGFTRSPAALSFAN
jgi:hypothetical protein